MPPTLKYLFRAANTITGGSIMTTATAITEPQSVAFCWKKRLQADREGEVRTGPQEHDGDQVVVPGQQEREDRRGQDAGQRVAQHDPDEAAEDGAPSIQAASSRVIGMESIVGGHHPDRDRHRGADVDDRDARQGVHQTRGPANRMNSGITAVMTGSDWTTNSSNE